MAMKISKEKRDRLILVGLIAAICLAGAYYLGVRAGQDQLARWERDTDQARKKFEDAQAFLKKSEGIEKEMEKLLAELRRIEESMVTPADPYAWSYQVMQSFGEEHKDVTVGEITRPQLDRTVGVLPEFPYSAAVFRVRGNGYYHDVGKFLADFENRFPYFRLQNLSLSPAASGERFSAQIKPEQVAFSIEIVALVRPATENP